MKVYVLIHQIPDVQGGYFFIHAYQTKQNAEAKAKEIVAAQLEHDDLPNC